MKRFLILAGAFAFAGVSAFGVGACTGTDASGNSITLSSPSFGTGSSLTGAPSDACSVGSITFTNFDVYGGSFSAPEAFNITFLVVNATTLQITTTNLGGNDIEIYFQTNQFSSPIGLSGASGETVTEGVCSATFNQSVGSEGCSPGFLNTSNLHIQPGAEGPVMSALNSSPSGTFYFVKDDSGGSQLTETFAPEPMTLSLMGVGLLGIGFLGRKLRK